MVTETEKHNDNDEFRFQSSTRRTSELTGGSMLIPGGLISDRLMPPRRTRLRLGLFAVSPVCECLDVPVAPDMLRVSAGATNPHSSGGDGGRAGAQ